MLVVGQNKEAISPIFKLVGLEEGNAYRYLINTPYFRDQIKFHLSLLDIIFI